MAEERVAALVVMRPAGGGEPGGREPITAETIERNAPEPEATERVRRFFAEQGFEVGPLVGVSFSIAAPRETTEQLFEGFGQLEGTGRELPLNALPPDIQEEVHAVTTEAPPDFGPGNP